MSGASIGNWGKFEKDMFRGMAVDIGVRATGNDKEGVLASQVAKVKAGHLHASTVKKFFLGLVTFGIYNICHSISAKNQRETTAALKQGVDNVHGALSYLSTMAQRDFQQKGAGADLRALHMGGSPSILPSSQADIDFLKASHCEIVQDANDPDFKGQPFIRTTMGGVEVDIGLSGLGGSMGAKVRINGVPDESAEPALSLSLGLDDKSASKKSASKNSIVTLPSLESALYAMEKDIVRATDVFGGDLVEKVLTRYDKRLELEKTANNAEKTVGVPLRTSIKSCQLQLSRDILTMRCGMSPERLDYLDRDLAKQLAIQAVKENITSGPALDAHYDKIVSQHHLVGKDMLALYDKLEAAGDVSRQIRLPAPAPQVAPGAGRPTAQQQGVHDFAADLLLADDISDYDKDVGASGYLDGMRLRNVFAKHKATIASLMDARAADKSSTPAALASLDPSMRDAVVKLIDTLNGRKQGGESSDQCLTRHVSDFDQTVSSREGKVEMDDLSKKTQFEKAGLGKTADDAFALRQKMTRDGADELDIYDAVDSLKAEDREFDYRRHGRANFFAQMELELNKSLEEAMANTVQAQVKTMIATVFPQENPAALDPKSSLATIVSDRASDPQMKLLKQTLDVYFERMGNVDKRNMMARLVRHTVDGASDGIRFGELLKGAGPILQKMMQGLDPDTFTDPNFRLAIADMRSKLAPIPEKAVKAQFADLIARSKGAIESITVTNALGAASVGQTFLCSIQMKGEVQPRECVIKMLRPDAHMRALREAEIFRDVAKGIEGMSLTFEGKLDGIMRELDLTIEADNVKTGLDVYDAGTHKVNKTFSNVASMRLSEIPGTEPTKGLMVLERAPGVPMDKFLEDANASIETARTDTIRDIRGRSPDSALVKMLEGAKSLTARYEDALAKHDALSNLTTIWIREGLFTKTGFYHGDLHAGNIMVPTDRDISRGVPNGVTMIDFGNATKLTPAEQKNVIRIIAGAAGNDPALFLNGLGELLSPAGKASLAGHRREVEGIVRDILAKGTGNDAGLRMTAVFKLLQAKFSIEVPPVIGGFQSSQERLTVAMESMLRTMTGAEMARLDVILAAAEKDGVAGPVLAPGDTPNQVFAKKKAAAIAYLEQKLAGDLTDDIREGLGELKEKLEQADKDRPLSMMQCMVAVIKQNIVTSLKTLGTSSAKTVTDHLTADGIIGGTATAAAADAEKERRFVEIRP